MGSFDKLPDQIDRLDAMSIDQLTAEMEQLMDAMTEETYDSTVIDAYVDAIHRKSAIPECPEVSVAFADFQRKVQTISGAAARRGQQAQSSCAKPHRKGFIRVSLAAALLSACLCAGVVVAQAAGVDVLDAVARWTGDHLSFGTISSETSEVPEEYQEIQEVLSERGLPFCYPEIPSDFELFEVDLFVDSDTDYLTYGTCYLCGDDFIGYDVTYNDGPPNTKYEKDDGPVEVYEYHNTIHYIFTNNRCKVAAWLVGSMEYAIFTNSDAVDIKELVRSIYK
jgi:hypothetical protein